MDVTAWIVESVRGGATQGSQLAHKVRSRFPNWSPEETGARNLRDFVERFVGGVTVVGRSGMDVVYGLSGEAGQGSDPDASVVQGQSVNYWRIWVSPNSPYALTISITTGGVGHVPRASAVDEGSSKLEPASQEFHEEIAREFTADARQARVSALPPIGGADGWWYGWQRSVKALGLEAEWHAHRTSALEARLQESLLVHNLSDEAREVAFGRIVRDRTLPREMASFIGPASDATRTELEAIVVAAVAQMESSDLRTLKIPLGVVLDVIAQRAAS